MANTLVQFRADETSRIKAAGICGKLGIDLRPICGCASPDSSRKWHPLQYESG